MAEDKKKEVKLEEIDLLGKKATFDREAGVIKLTNAQLEEVYAERGLTKEVRDLVTTVIDDVRAEVLDVTTPLVVKEHKAIRAQLGTGSFSIDQRQDGKVEKSGKVPGTDKTYESVKYGTVTSTVRIAFGRKLTARDGKLAACAAEIEAAWDKK